jgi:Flp pilus assembly protein TadD
MMPVDEALGLVSHQLGFADDRSGVEVDAVTIPPAEPDVEEHATVPPGAEPPAKLEEARTMAPPRFRHLQAAVGAPSAQAFSDEEIPTNKVRRMLGRVETQRLTVRAGRHATESTGDVSHTDHAVTRPSKSTQLGLAPVFEMLPQSALDEQKTIPAPRKPTPPPPPPESRKPAAPPLFEADAEFEPELARILEGPVTLLAPAPAAGGMPAWLQLLLLLTLLAGVGVFGWQLWVRSDSAILAEDEQPASPAEAMADRQGELITGTVNGLEPKDGEDEAVEQAEPAPIAAQPTAAEAPEQAPEPVPVEAKPEREPARPEPEERSPAAADSSSLAIPTQNLPRDPSKASDVLVHRALPLIRRGQLRLAEATLDRAWELDPSNPQAMAGYAALYIAKKDGERAVKWAKKAVRKRSRRAEYHVLYGDALQLEGESEAAQKSWRKALKVDPENKAARSRLNKANGDSAN